MSENRDAFGGADSEQLSKWSRQRKTKRGRCRRKGCDKRFTGVTRQHYCSDACRIAAFRDRKRDAKAKRQTERGITFHD